MRRLYLVLAFPLLPFLVLLAYLQGWIPRQAIVAVLLIMAGVELFVLISVVVTGHGGSGKVSQVDPASVLYADGLVTILADRIIFHRYSFLSSREVLFSELAAIRALPPLLKNGRWRLGGTSDFDTWFPSDWCRFRRDTIFRAEMKQPSGYHVGFTVKDSATVRKLLRDLGVLHPICPKCQYDLRASAGRCPECGAEIPPEG